MILALDLGSTSFKAALVDRRLRERRFSSRSLRYHYAAGGQVELPVSGVKAALHGAVADALGGDAGAVEAVAITSQAQTFTLLDARGRPGMPFISWRDGRPDAVAAARRLQRLLPDFGADAGFGQVLSALQIAQLAALRPGPDARPVLLPSYVLRLLTGELRVDVNQAAMTGLYSLRTGGWNAQALQACGIKVAQLPGLVPVGAVGGVTGRGAGRFGLPAGIPVVLAGNDQTAGAYGAELERRGRVLLSLGTAIAVYACSDSLPAAAPQRIRGPYPGGGYYRMTTDSCGGGLITWAQTLLAGCADDDAFFAAASRAPRDARGLRFEPSPESGGGDWHGGGPQHGPGDFARAVLEGLSRRVADRVAELGLSQPPERIRVAGGGSCRRLWLAMIAAQTGLPCSALARATPLRGAARMAVRALREAAA